MNASGFALQALFRPSSHASSVESTPACIPSGLILFQPCEKCCHDNNINATTLYSNERWGEYRPHPTGTPPLNPSEESFSVPASWRRSSPHSRMATSIELSFHLPILPSKEGSSQETPFSTPTHNSALPPSGVVPNTNSLHNWFAKS